MRTSQQETRREMLVGICWCLVDERSRHVMSLAVTVLDQLRHWLEQARRVRGLWDKVHGEPDEPLTKEDTERRFLQKAKDLQQRGWQCWFIVKPEQSWDSDARVRWRPYPSAVSETCPGKLCDKHILMESSKSKKPLVMTTLEYWKWTHVWRGTLALLMMRDDGADALHSWPLVIFGRRSPSRGALKTLEHKSKQPVIF